MIHVYHCEMANHQTGYHYVTWIVLAENIEAALRKAKKLIKKAKVEEAIRLDVGSIDDTGTVDA